MSKTNLAHDGDVRPKILRDYQVDAIASLVRTKGDILVEQPPGAGKTLEVSTYLALELGRKFTHAIVAAPQCQISDGFLRNMGTVVAWPSTSAAQRDVVIPPSFFRLAGSGKRSSVRNVSSYLTLDDPREVIVCTHATLTKMLEALHLPGDLSRVLLVVDEAHHAPALRLGAFVAAWKKRGGRLAFFSATPFRPDGKPVRLPGMHVVRRPLAQHMEEGDAPARLECEFVLLGQREDHVSESQFDGEEAPPESYDAEIAEKITTRWLADGRPKAIVRVPPLEGGSQQLVAAVVARLEREKAVVLDATGVDDDRKERFQDALAEERTRSFAESKLNVIVGIMRVNEGTDWPHCAAVYAIGVPASLTASIQLAGRALRAKPSNYPEPYTNMARVVFFAPAAGGAALAELSVAHSRHTLLAVCFMADHRIGHAWILIRTLRDAAIAAIGTGASREAIEAIEQDIFAPLDDEELRSEVIAATVAVRDELIRDGIEPLEGDVLARVRHLRPDFPEELVERVAAEVLVGEPGEEGAEACRALARYFARELKIRPEVRAAMRAAFAAVVEEFRGRTLARSPVLDEVGRQIHIISGRDAIAFAARLLAAAPVEPWTLDRILEWADHHERATKEFPTAETGPVLAADGVTWKAVDSALRTGDRGVGPGTSLARLLDETGRRPNRLGRRELTIPEILVHADDFQRTNGRFPNRDSGLIAGTGKTWCGAEQVLRRAGQGTLAQLLARARKKRNKHALPKLTIEWVVEKARAFKKKIGLWPTREDGQIDGAIDGDTWGLVESYLQQELRGFPRWPSLAALFAALCGARSNREIRLNLTRAKLIELIDAYRRRNGRAFPTATTPDPELETRGDSWPRIDKALRECRRGIARRSSLKKFIVEVYGHGKKPRLTDARLRDWAIEHRRRTGEWPIRTSGPVCGHLDESWENLHADLCQGRRGLVGKRTLAQFIRDVCEPFWRRKA